MRLDQFSGLGIRKTRFVSLQLKASMLNGVPLGQGACLGVELSANHFQTGTAVTPQGAQTGLKFYFGDDKQQTEEYLINTNTTAIDTNTRTTGFIPCTDLNQIWVKFSDAAPATIEIQIRVYSCEYDDVSS